MQPSGLRCCTDVFSHFITIASFGETSAVTYVTLRVSELLWQSEKQVRKQMRREKMERQHYELSRLRTLLRLNTVLAGLARDNVKSDFLAGKHGAAVSLSHYCGNCRCLYKEAC